MALLLPKHIMTCNTLKFKLKKYTIYNVLRNKNLWDAQRIVLIKSQSRQFQEHCKFLNRVNYPDNYEITRYSRNVAYLLASWLFNYHEAMWPTFWMTSISLVRVFTFKIYIHSFHFSLVTLGTSTKVICDAWTILR